MIHGLSEGDLIANTHGETFLKNTSRILFIDQYFVYFIALPNFKDKPGKSKHICDYVKAPIKLDTKTLIDLLDSGKVYVLRLAEQQSNALSDVDKLRNAKDEKARKSVEKSIHDRDYRYNVIRKIICEATLVTKLRSFRQIIDDPARSLLIKEAAEEHKISTHTVYHYLHLFWAGGSTKRGLETGYQRCGNPGQPKKQTQHLGRKTNLYKNKLTPSPGVSLSEDCKRKLQWGYMLVNKHTTLRDAYLITMSTHWAAHEVDEKTGEVHQILVPSYQRPSFQQFKRWGEQLNQTTITEILLGPVRTRQVKHSRGGSELDMIVGAGELSAFDGTSTDVYLVRTNDRLKRIPPMTRMILKDIRTQIIYGIYCGMEPPSPSTALRTILHGAAPDKSTWAARFGIKLPDGSIPAMLARHHLADHGELKSAETTEAEEQFGFGLECPPTMRGDLKGGVESQHHADHAHLDRKIPGNTQGKRPERGEIAPVTEALHNYYEYMGLLIKHIIWHNTVQEVPNLAPDDMLLEYSDKPITRIEIYNWLIKRGMNTALPYNFNDLRAFCLPDHDAVIDKNGLFLVTEIAGTKQRVKRLRYSSEELIKTGLMSQVKQTGSPIHTKVKLDTNDPSQVWLPSKAGLIHLTNSIRDTTINTKFTLSEWIEFTHDYKLAQALRQDVHDQIDAEKVIGIRAISDRAQHELNQQIKANGKKPTKAQLKRDLLMNRTHELESIKADEAQGKTKNYNSKVTKSIPEQPHVFLDTTSDDLMDSFMAGDHHEH
jgi:hypothetical protein